MKKKSRNAGFSLVELIITITIMAVLVGILAPQYIKYVARTKKAVDVDSAVEVRGAFERVFADDDTTFPVAGGVATFCWDKNATIQPAATDIGNRALAELGEVPVSKYDEDLYWNVVYDGSLGVVYRIYLSTSMGGGTVYEVYPDPNAYLNN